MATTRDSPLITSRVFALQRRTIENQRRKFEVESAPHEIELTLSLVPGELHREYTLVYTEFASDLLLLTVSSPFAGAVRKVGHCNHFYSDAQSNELTTVGLATLRN